MTRRVPLLRAVACGACATIVLSGCATFTDDDVAARVGDVELSRDELAGLLVEATGGVGIEREAPGEVARGVINQFVLNEALQSDLVDIGGVVPVVTDQDLTLASLQEELNLTFQAWQETPPPPADEGALRAFYERGAVDSNITCTKHILVETEAAASEIIAELEAGADFAELASERSIDAGSAAAGGVIPCDATGNFAQTYVPEYVEAALGAELGDIVGPVESQFGSHVIAVRSFDDLDSDERDAISNQVQVRFDLATADLDVYVDPRYGAFSGSRGIVALG